MKVLLFATLFFVSVQSAYANTPNLKAQMDLLFSTLAKKSFSEDRKAQKLVTESFNFVMMSKNILGTQVKKQGAQEFDWFVRTIREIVIKTVYPEAPDFFKGVKFYYEEMEKEGKGYKLLSIVSKRGEETEVLLTFMPDGKEWRITDVAIDDESWVSNIRDQVFKTIKKDHWKGLKELMNNRLSTLLNKKGKK